MLVVVFLWLCFCDGVVLFLGVYFCRFKGVVVVAFLRFPDFVVLFLWMGFCGGVVVFFLLVLGLCFCGGAAVFCV